jgi:glycosyltransferase involved in cell wall biosynthesis
MTDMAGEWQRQRGRCWFVVPRPRRPFVNGVGRPTVWDLLTQRDPAARPHLEAPTVGDGYEFGTEAYRAGIYASAVRKGVPAGVPLIVSDDPGAWRAAAWLAGRNPFIAVVHGELDLYDRLVQHYAPHVSAFVGVSHRVTRRIRNLLGHDRIPTVTIPCGIRLPSMHRRVHAPSAPIRLAWVGRMQEEAKRISDLPKIAACLRERGVPFAMDIMGDGDQRQTLTEDIFRRQLTDVVRLRPWGTPAEVQSLLSDADLLLLPSNREGMPITVMEALGLGCGVVASRVSGVEDYEHHLLAADCFWVHAVGDVSAAATAVQRAAEIDPAHRSARARALAEAEFAVERSVERYEPLVRELPVRESLRPNILARGHTLRRAVSMLVAAQRIARLWSSRRYRRPEPVMVQ